MRRSSLAMLLALALVPPAALRAQDPSREIVVRTFTLQNLSPKDAADLISPYVSHIQMGGVYEAGGALRAITVRATAGVIARVDSLLRANDRPRAAVVFRFQLIAASDSAVRDPAISAIDAELRGLFRFAGYRLLSQGTVTANDRESYTLTMRGSDGVVFDLSGNVFAIQTSGGKGSAQISVHLSEKGNFQPPQRQNYRAGTLVSTGLTVPFGQTVVLGSAVSSGDAPALILTVRPELVPKP
jgi:hypothetical protein